ncbi:MAG: hypothetical protein LBD70_01880, partial [Bifidobacteriaceae bacterium]|nr:hypothetical protein [Bifidobacteriaceae bacterium]
MSTVTTPPAIRAYAKAVREALTGLDPDQAQELTDGLELDLTDALADSEEPSADPAWPPAGPDAPDDAAGPPARQAVPAGALTFERIVRRFGD